jgi:hypothetical protein
MPKEVECKTMTSQKKSKTQCCLQADGFRVMFYLSSYHSKDRTHIGINVVLLTEAGSVELNLNSRPQPIPIEDLWNFIINLEKYLESVEKNPQTGLTHFKSINEVFQVLIFGALSSDENPYFIINFMIRVSSIKPRIMNPYMGTQAAITLENLRSFATLFRQTLKELF